VFLPRLGISHRAELVGEAKLRHHRSRHALFDNKPAYFAAGALPPYDMELQHRREATGRLIDPSGTEHLRWKESVRDALLARLTHLDSLR
jgi:hypothetical protein